MPDFMPEAQGVQQDAHGFLRWLLDKLDATSVAPIPSLDEPSSTEESRVAKDTFRGHLKSQLHCPECNHSSDRSEPFLDLSLGIDMVDTLIDAVQSFTKVEVIEDVMCDGCKSRVRMEKHYKVEQAPEVLVIHLKRFLHYGDNNISKIWDKVKYPLELDMNPFMISSDDTPQKYDLYGVVEHYGTYARGHYVCYIRSSQADWYKFDDDKVSRYYEAEVLNSTAYILFYVKQGSSPWFSTLLEGEDKLPLDGSVSMAEQGSRELDLVNNKEEESLSSRGQDNSCCLGGTAEENGNGPSLLDLSQHLQSNGNDNKSSVAPDKLEGGCSLSGGTQELSCLTGSGDKNGHVDGHMEPSENKDDGSPRGSLGTKEMNRSTHGSLEDDNAGTQEGSPRKNDNTLTLLQTSSHKHEDNCYHEDELRDSSGAPSIRMRCASEKKTTVESNSNHEFRNDNDSTIKGKCKQL